MDSGLGIGGLSLSKDEIASSSFDVFSPIEIENSIDSAVKIITRPISSATSSGPFKFVFPADSVKWTDCETIRLCGRVKLVKNNGNGTLTDYAAEVTEASVVNNFFQSLFSSISCTINGVEMTDPSGNWYPYKAYLETLLSYSKSTKEGRLVSNAYFQDTPTKFDNYPILDGNSKTTTPSSNEGFKKRSEFFKLSKMRYFNIPLHIDLCTLRKYLPPNTKLEIEFQRTKDNFSLLSPYPNDDIQIVIEDLSLSLSRFTPSIAIKKWYGDKLGRLKKQILPIDRSLIKTYT